MGYISDLPHATDTSWVDGLINKSGNTTLYITIAGDWHAELVECLDCLYLDNKRQFELIQLKKEPRFIAACISMMPIVKREETK